MPKHIEQRLREQLRDKGLSPAYAAAAARKKMREAGNVEKDNTLTAKGAERSRMGAAGRAKDRAAKATGRKPSEYTYNPMNNTARLKRASTKGRKS